MCVRASIEPLLWESEFFAFPSSKLVFSEQSSVLQREMLNDDELIQAKVPSQCVDLIDNLSNLGFSLAEGEIDLALQIHSFPATEPNSEQFVKWKTATAQSAHIPELRDIATKAFSLSRFRPPWYRKEDSGRFYALWVEKAVLGTFDHQCLLLLDNNNALQGFVTLRHLGNGEARMGLLATQPDAIGKGIGTQLMIAAERWCVEHQIHCLRIATQLGNLNALKLYFRRGAILVSTSYWFYRGLL